MADAKREIVVHGGTTARDLTQPAGPVTARNAPAIVKAAGKSAEFAWEEFFQAELANAHTRKNYMHAVRRFLAAINRDDAEGICAELDEQVKWRTPAIPGVTPAREFDGHTAVLEVWSEVKATTRGDLRVVLQNIEADHDGVLAEGALSTPGGTTPIGYVIQMRERKIRTAETFVNPGQAKLAWDRRVNPT